MINTLKYAKILEEAGFSREQAETSIKILVEIMEDKLATKQDMAELKVDLKSVKAEMATKQDLVLVKNDILQFKHDILQVKHDLTIRMGAMLTAAVTLTVALLTALHKFI